MLEGCIPEEWKSGNRVHDSQRAQIGIYFILIEEETGVAPPYGVISLGSGQEVRLENTAELREWVLDVADQIRAARRRIQEEIEVRQRQRNAGRAGCGRGVGREVDNRENREPRGRQ